MKGKEAGMNLIKALRAERGWTIAQLARAAEIDPATISLLENNRRKAQAVTLGKLARVFEVPVTTLAELADTTAAQRGRIGGYASHASASRVKD